MIRNVPVFLGRPGQDGTGSPTTSELGGAEMYAHTSGPGPTISQPTQRDALRIGRIIARLNRDQGLQPGFRPNRRRCRRTARPVLPTSKGLFDRAR